MRKLTLLGTLAFVNFATAGLGRYIDGDNGKLAISNITPVLFLLAAVPLFLSRRERVDRSVIGFVLFFNAFGWLSFLIFLLKYGWAPNVAVLGFQEIEIVFCLLLIWYARDYPAEFRATVRAGIICSAAISLGYGFQAVAAGNVFVLVFGMDDKSQAAVLFCCQAFILVRYFGRPLDNIVAAALMIMSFTTLSRLPVAFVPVVMFALARKSTFGFAFTAILCVVSVGVIIATGDTITKLFKVFDRLASIDAVATDSATSAHVLLLKTAVRMKFYDVETFFFGSGAGNFAKALTDFPMSFEELSALDPQLISDARIGRAPMHSLPFSALLDYSIAVFFMLVFFSLQAIRYMVRHRRNMELMFFASLFGASMFYSLHNKHYLYLLCTAIYLLMSSTTARQSRPVMVEALPLPAS